MKNEKKIVANVFEKINLGIPIQLTKLENVTDKSIGDVIGIAKSNFYNTKTLFCFNFYKHISRVLSKNDI